MKKTPTRVRPRELANYGAGDMYTRIIAALTTFLISSTALAWSVPIHMCTFPGTPTPVGDPIPCTYTNQDGQSFNGVVTRTSNGEVLCTGLLAPTPDDPAQADSIEELYSSLGDEYGDAPYCALDASPKGIVAECSDKWPDDSNPQAAIKVCGDGWCLELTAYTDCADYASTEIQFEGVTCYDVT
jgi:hypothetical protein